MDYRPGTLVISEHGVVKGKSIYITNTKSFFSISITFCVFYLLFFTYLPVHSLSTNHPSRTYITTQDHLTSSYYLCEDYTSHSSPSCEHQKKTNASNQINTKNPTNFRCHCCLVTLGLASSASFVQFPWYYHTHLHLHFVPSLSSAQQVHKHTGKEPRKLP